MALRPQSCRLLRLNPRISPSQCLFKPSKTPKLSIRHISSKPPSPPRNPLDPIAMHRLQAEHRAYYKRRFRYSLVGMIFGMVGMFVVVLNMDAPTASKMDAGSIPPNDPMANVGKDRKVLIQPKTSEETGEVMDQVPTGTSTIPTFPRVVEYADLVGEGWKEEGLKEYQLMGLGVRTVSFLGIEVYVVGVYVATDDIATLQQRLIRKIDPIATTLVAGEKDKLKQQLLDGEKSEQIWNEVLKDGGVRSLVRIVPCKNTDFHHMRDAWVRALKARAQKNPEEYSDESFGLSVQQFKSMLTGGSVPKGREMLLARGRKGELSIWYDDGKEARRLGGLDDERVSRAVWLNYLGGKTVASEKARESVVHGVMEYVERPVGSVATQVHV